jgi:hypothetical protein
VNGLTDNSVARIGIATAAALLAAFVGGCIGFLIAKVLMERVGLVEGPPAGVLLVLSATSGELKRLR